MDGWMESSTLTLRSTPCLIAVQTPRCKRLILCSALVLYTSDLRLDICRLHLRHRVGNACGESSSSTSRMSRCVASTSPFRSFCIIFVSKVSTVRTPMDCSASATVQLDLEG